ncbi:MAG: glutamate-1-semialdehyde 2,1-aminomutase [Sediminibacterium sp.]|nr:glutamate-1-semialdehyde 2,1-aminomutase [Sediminibacterium sp.]
MENEYSVNLNKLIPGGAHTYSRGNDQFPANAPSILEKGKGAYVWAPDGTRYLDYGMALRAVTIGYANERVNQAAIRQIENGVNLTRATTIELQAAQTMIDLIPGAEMVKFAKNGSNVTTAAVKIARAYTGRKYVCVPRQQPFFSFDDWFIGITPIKKGIPQEHYACTLLFDYNDINSLKLLFDQYPGQIAAVIMEPATTLNPCKGDGCVALMGTELICANCKNNKSNFLHQVQNICRRDGAVFIIDEMITGFRWHLQGAQTYFDIEPDLSTFGKGMANGFAVAALVGKKELMDVGAIDTPGAERTFLISTTHGAEMPGMGALIETIAIYKEQNVIAHLWEYGKKLFDGINEISNRLGLSDFFYMDGGYVSMNYVTKDKNGAVSMAFRTLFAQELIKKGVLMPWIAPSYSHGNEELDITLNAAEAALKVYKLALEEGVEKYLVGPEIKPVFRQFN